MGSEGWDVLRAVLRGIYPDQPDPVHIASVPTYAQGGSNPLDGVSIFAVPGSHPHWHYVTFGLSDLDGTLPGSSVARADPDHEDSGYGFELTFRLADVSAGSGGVPPQWPLKLLQDLARYVFGTGNVFEHGHHMDLRRPIGGPEDTTLTGLLFADDPVLPHVRGPLGRVSWIQVVGVTADELAAARRWNTTGMLRLLDDHDTPWWVADPTRASVLVDPARARVVAKGVQEEGSGYGFLNVMQMRVDAEKAEVRLTAEEARAVAEVLPLRLPFGRTLTVFNGDHALVLAPDLGEPEAPPIDDLAGYRLRLDADAVVALVAQLEAGPGEYRVEGDDVVVTVVD